MTTVSKDQNAEPQRLQAGVLSVPNGIALAAAAMAPVIAVVLNAPAAAPSAGSFYTLNSAGLGPEAGFATV